MSNSPIYVEDDSPPPDTRASSLSKATRNESPPSEKPHGPARSFFVEPPQLASAKMQRYKPLNESSLNADAEIRVDEVIGEYREGKYLYYFARYKEGIAHKYLSSTFKNEDLVNKYKKKKADGTLDSFDPSAHYIHPLSRVRTKIRIPSDSVSRVSRSRAELVPDSDSEESESNGEEDDDYNGPKRRTQLKQSSRVNNKKELPFSPRKSRLRKVLTIDDSESDNSATDEDEAELSRPTKRSTRSRKVTKIQIDSDDYEFIDDSDGDQAHGKTSKVQAKKNKGNRPKTIMPMYGHVRDMKTLNADPFSDDEENEALRRHRQICEKCHQAPASKLLAIFQKKSKSKGKKRKRNTDDEFEESDDQEKYINMGGWLQCLNCPVVAHWSCLASTQRDEVLKAVREVDRQELERQQDNSSVALPRKRKGLGIDQITEFVCGACMRGGTCLGCMETALEPDASQSLHIKMDTTEDGKDEDVVMGDGENTQEALLSPKQVTVRSLAHELLFRCFTCKRLAHYRHLPKPSGFDDNISVPDIAEHYQTSKMWLCADCSSYKYGLDKLLAWRPYPPNAVESPRGQEPVLYKMPLPREYLVKWSGRSYRRIEWVPHMWLLSTHPSKLKNFIAGGSKVELLSRPIEEDQDAMDVDDSTLPPTFEKDPDSRASSNKPENLIVLPSTPLPDAEKRIPIPWKTVDRVLDVILWRPTQKKKTSNRLRKNIASSSEDEDDENVIARRRIFEKAEQPPSHLTETVEEWEKHSSLESANIDDVVWAFIKWDELGYEEATWDAPPRTGEAGYTSFKVAFDRFIESRNVVIPEQKETYWETFDNRNKAGFQRYVLKDAADLELGQPKNLKLMPFQVDGFNWLCSNWWDHQHCILADEMGLGKTVQIVTFLGNIAANWRAFPALVVVPNSTITNWVREFERWAPKLRVVPFFGEKNARDVIKEFELYHKAVESGNLKTKFHVLVTTYETLTNTKDSASIFKNQPRWEVLVVDEGQRLKSDSSLLFRKLKELNSIHRIIMTGTPLNNNMRELFNLMNFLDPVEWRDLEALEKQHETLDEELVKQLHTRLRPYFLRRIKSEVLQLPPKNEVIVPVSMAPLQREVYRSILTNNVEILKGLAQPSVTGNAPAKGRINNVLMQLRKCLQHPYLYDEDIEPRNLAPQEIHEKLIDGSGKLRFLKSLLRQLKERGHRVLLFSQFVIALNVIEDFLQGEGYKFLRLDGNTKGAVRQKSMDEFNKPDSEYFIFLLTTRAGGVGINLFTADTVIIFDPDFNPHQDLQIWTEENMPSVQIDGQRIRRRLRTERIMQIGKKKLVLDHLIVQKMDDDEDDGGENVQSILTYGAQAIFDSEPGSRDISYTEQDIEKLIEKTEKTAVQEAPKAAGGLTFEFAKIWAADKDALEEVTEEDQTDSWAQTLQVINTEREKQQIEQRAHSGRGVRRRAADIAKTKMSIVADGSQVFERKSKKKDGAKGAASDGSVYDAQFSDIESASASEPEMADGDFTVIERFKHKVPHNPLGSIQNIVPGALNDCGLCGQQHSYGQCAMVQRSENLAEYREMLILHADDEPWETRTAAVQAIDEILQQRGHVALIAGQPLLPVPKSSQGPPALKKPKGPKVNGSTKHASTSREADQPIRSKKPTTMPPSPCLLCHSEMPHFLKDCPVVRAGSKSISKHIQSLESQKDASLTGTITTLRSLLAKAKARELANVSSANGSMMAGPSHGTAP